MKHLRYNLLLFVGLLTLAASVNAQTKDFQIDPSDKYHRFTVAGTGTIPIYNLTNHKLQLHYHDQVQSNIVIRTGSGFDLDTSRFYSVYNLEIGYGYSTEFHRDEIVIYDTTGADTIIVEGADTSASSLYLPFNTQNESLLTFHHNRAEAFGWINFESGSSDIEIANLTLTQPGSAFWLDSNYIAIPAQTDIYHPGWTGTRVHYRRTGNPYDTAYLTIGSPRSSAHHTFLVSAIADSQISEVELTAPSVGYGALTPGDSVCKDFIIYNSSDMPVTITALSYDSVNPGYRSDFKVHATLPISLGAHSSVAITTCLGPAPSAWDTNEWRRIHVHYTDTLGFSDEIYGDLYARIVKCVATTPDSLEFGSMISGGTVRKTIRVTNNMRDTAVISDSVLLFGSIHVSFPNGDPFPMTLAPGESDSVVIELSDTAVGWNHAQLLLYPRDSAGNLLCESTNEMILHVIGSEDSGAISIYGGQTDFLPIVSDLATITKIFTFVNDATDSIKVVSATLTGSSGHFTITDITPSLPVTLPSFGRIQVTVEFDADTNGIYRDTLIIVTDNALVAYRIPIVGSRKNGVLADVAGVATVTPMVAIYPNPATDEVRIVAQDLTVTQVEVLDILGHSVSAVHGSVVSVKNLPAGRYVARITGRSAVGIVTTISRMLEVK